jgi:hypothetical protein
LDSLAREKDEERKPPEEKERGGSGRPPAAVPARRKLPPTPPAALLCKPPKSTSAEGSPAAVLHLDSPAREEEKERGRRAGEDRYGAGAGVGRTSEGPHLRQKKTETNKNFGSGKIARANLTVKTGVMD